MKKYLILENIRSAYNVGAMFRTAEGAGVTKIFLCGYTPTPTDRFGRVQAEIEKTSLGASDIVAWEQIADTVTAIQRLHTQGVVVVALESTDHSIPLRDYVGSDAVAYVVGNEVDGVSEQTIAAADHVVHIPMLGHKESLNVSTAAGIILYHGLV